MLFTEGGPEGGVSGSHGGTAWSNTVSHGCFNRAEIAEEAMAERRGQEVHCRACG